MTRLAFRPLKEAYFVGIGAIDWALEKAMTVEKELAERGHRRNEMLGRMASMMSAGVSDKTRAMSNRGRARMRRMGEKICESMQEEEPQRDMAEAKPA